MQIKPPIEESRAYDQRYEVHFETSERPYLSIFDKRFGFLYILHPDGHWSVTSPFITEKGDARFKNVDDLIPELK